MISRPLSIAILACAGLATPPQVLALGFGRIPESVPFGQSLDLSVPLRLDAGETLTSACLHAEVKVGELRLPPDKLLITLEGGASQLRIRSVVAVQEPLVEVSLAVGCNGGVSRQFVVLAEPPSARAEAPQTAPPELPPALRVAAVAVAVADSVPRYPQVNGPRAGAQSMSDPSAPQVRSLATSSATPRLELVGSENLLKATMLTVAAQDAALAALEAKLVALRSEAAANRAGMESMRTRLEQAEVQGRGWLALGAAIVALGTLALWLGWRMRALQRERQSAWWGAAEDKEDADAAFALSAPQAEACAAQARPRARPQLALPPTVQDGDALTGSVSIDALIDLEQQAEFFRVLGDEDAAVELLQAHLLSTGDSSPLPHLKLLAFYRRRGEREAYARTRLALPRHFDSAVPGWDAGATAQRGLDDYPAALARVQARWHRPIEAMGELQDLVFHRRGGDCLSLVAYRDALMLYAVARDLQRHKDASVSDVDVLLPLPAVDAVGGGRPTSPVDLDLSEAPESVRATLR